MTDTDTTSLANDPALAESPQAVQDARSAIGETLSWTHPQTKQEHTLQKFALTQRKWWSALRVNEGGSSMGEVTILIYILTHPRKETARLFRQTRWVDVQDPETEEWTRELHSCPLLDKIEAWADETFLTMGDLEGAKEVYNKVFERIDAATATPLESETDDDGEAGN